MAKFEKHIFVCGNQRPPENPRGCCDPDQDGQLHQAFKRTLAGRGLKSRVRANKAGCLDQCEHGPTVVIYPDEVWYGGVTPADVEEIVDSHVIAGHPVARLLLAPDCINTASCEHKPRKVFTKPTQD